MNEGAGASVQRAYIAERDIAWLRLAVIVFNVALYIWWLPHDPQLHTLALAVSLVALLYALVVVVLRPYEYLPVLRTSTYTLITDSALITLWLFATGGLASPFYALWLLSLMAVVFRFGPLVVGIATMVYAAADLAMLAASGDLAGNVAAVAPRPAYILLLGALGTLLGHRWTSAVQQRVAATREVARREEAFREAQRLRILSDAAFEGIVIHRGGKILEANPAACRVLGRPREKLLQMDATHLIDPDSAADLARSLATPSERPTELWIRRDGQRRRLAIQARDLDYQGEPARIAALRDITEEYEARRAKEVAAVQQMEIARLQELDEFKTRFINTAAHELNTPLTPIKLQLHLLRDEMRHRPRALDILERNLDRLARLVADMLDVARLQSGRIKIRNRAVDLVPVCDEVFETFLPTAEGQRVNLDRLLPDRMIGFGDPERIVQIVTNLLSNAFKFTPPGGRVTLLARETQDRVRIEVIDTGKGLTQEDMERLFQPFSQAHNDPTIPGTGLGLYICKNLAQAMGGTLGVASEGPGHGARFWLDLPREGPADPPRAAEASVEAAPATALPDEEDPSGGPPDERPRSSPPADRGTRGGGAADRRAAEPMSKPAGPVQGAPDHGASR